MLGGRTECFSQDKSELLSFIHCFDPVLESWSSHESSGELPPGIYDGACTSYGNCIYVHGGTDGSKFNSLHNSLHKLDTESWTWKELCPQSMRKFGSEMIACDNKLVLFGGCGYLSEPAGEADYVTVDGPVDEKLKWTNGLHVFDHEKGEVGKPQEIQSWAWPHPHAHRVEGLHKWPFSKSQNAGSLSPSYKFNKTVFFCKENTHMSQLCM